MKNDFNYFQYYDSWATGEIEQGKWMIGVGLVILIPFLIIILKSSNVLLRGMTVPITLLLAVSLGYGGYLLINRLKSVEHKKHSINCIRKKHIKENAKKQNQIVKLLCY